MAQYFCESGVRSPYQDIGKMFAGAEGILFEMCKGAPSQGGDKLCAARARDVLGSGVVRQ